METPRTIEVAVFLPVDKTYSYSVPEKMGHLERGAIVCVPFGKRMVTGLVVSNPTGPSSLDLKEVISVLQKEPVSGKTMDFYEMVAEEYLSTVGDVVRMALPPGMSNGKRETYVRIGPVRALVLEGREKDLVGILEKKGPLPIRVAEKRFKFSQAELKKISAQGLIEIYGIDSSGDSLAKHVRYAGLSKGITAASFRSRGKKELEIIKHLEKHGEKISVRELSERIKGAGAVIARLKEKGAVEIFSVEEERNPFLEKIVERDTPPELYEDQRKADGEISILLEAERHETFLLHGITGSGKTEVYLRAIAKVLERGKTALALVPEIALTPQFVRRFRARFGEVISVIHSSMSKGERYDQWRKILRGDAKIVIGARSALFAPLSNIGIIVVDEEHDHSYKQENGIMYNARELAIKRGRIEGAVVVLGSATPSVESFHRAKAGLYRLLTLSSRASGQKLPEVEIVDLKEEKGKFGKKGFISEKLLAAIRENAAKGGKTILFLNRRGFSSFVICMRCGVSVKCPNCSVSLKYHEERQALLCHYCAHQTPLFGFCETCGQRSLVKVGFGTEQLEKEIKSHFPDLRVERMDRDTTVRKFSHENIIRRLEKGEIDILIGTQMVSKGLDAKKVTLVGVVLADISLNIPDFRSCERTFSLLTQVSGRSGRGDVKGNVIVQTYSPENYAVALAKNHDYLSFFSAEIEFRKDLGYPPFKKLANIKISSQDLDALKKHSKKIRQISEKCVEEAGLLFETDIEILGPSPAPLEKLKGEYRWQTLIKAKDDETLHNYLLKLSKHLKEKYREVEELSLKIDIDPHNFM